MMTTHPLRLATLATATVLLGACTLAPVYQRPASPVGDSWPAPAVAATGDATTPDWQQFIADDRLRQLVALALANNRDLRVAALNIEKARAAYRIQGAELLPAIGVAGSNSNSRVSADLSSTGSSYVTRSVSANVGVSAWELDLFGRLRSLNRQALESYLATVETRRATQTSLISETASAWLTLGADQEQLKLARDTLQARQEAYDLIARKAELGVSSQLELAQARTTVETARADAASYTSQVARDRNALVLLVGQDIPAGLLPAALPEQVSTLRELPAGLPSTVLQQRPDILAAEHRLKGANANIGAARAAFFPSITLTGSVGSASDQLSGLFESGTQVWAFAPQVNLPIFSGGRLLAGLKSAKVEREIATAQYEKAIQTAFREVADALADHATLDTQLQARGDLVQASADSFRLSQARFDKGADSYLALLDAQRSLYAAQQSLISTRLARENNLITLYKVLGGGADTPEPSATR